MATPVIIYEWTGEDMKPLPRFHNMANASFVVGERYQLAEVKERSRASHNHYFASLQEAFDNLPDSVGCGFADVEHFRARGLIEAGFCDEYRFVGASSADAAKAVAAVVRGDPYALVSIADRAAVVRIAQSQAYLKMDKARFQQAKQAVLDWAWSLVGISPAEARKHAGRAA